jgi:ATP synthase protein I
MAKISDEQKKTGSEATISEQDVLVEGDVDKNAEAEVIKNAKLSAYDRIETEREEADKNFKPLTREEVRAMRLTNPSVSPWLILAGQSVAGVLIASFYWLITGSASAGWSAFYGALVVLVPGAVFARGLMSKVASMNPGAAVTGFFLWEFVKIGLAIAMLFAAPRLVLNLSWPAMLVGLVVTMKVVWLVLWLRARLNSNANAK